MTTPYSERNTLPVYDVMRFAVSTMEAAEKLGFVIRHPDDFPAEAREIYFTARSILLTKLNAVDPVAKLTKVRKSALIHTGKPPAKKVPWGKQIAYQGVTKPATKKATRK